MIRVEFIGIPGVGKTSIRRNLVRRLKKTNSNKYLIIEEAILKVSRLNIDKIYRQLLNILPDVVAVKLSNKLMNRSIMQFEAQNRFLAKWGKSFEIFLASKEFDEMSVDERQVVISGFLHMGSLFECINGQFSDKQVVFFEEGFVQKSFMFITTKKDDCEDKNNLFKYLDQIPLPDLIIYIKTDIKTCYERMVARPQGLTERLKCFEKKEIFNFLEKSATYLEEEVFWLRENKHINLIEINNDQCVEYNIEKLINRIRAF